MSKTSTSTNQNTPSSSSSTNPGHPMPIPMDPLPEAANENEEEEEEDDEEQERAPRTEPGIKSYLHLLYERVNESVDQGISYHFHEQEEDRGLSARTSFGWRLLRFLARTLLITSFVTLIAGCIMTGVGFLFPRRNILVRRTDDSGAGDFSDHHFLDARAFQANVRLHELKVWGFGLVCLSLCVMSLVLVVPSLVQGHHQESGRRRRDGEEELLIGVEVASANSSSSSAAAPKRETRVNPIPAKTTVKQVQPKE